MEDISMDELFEILSRPAKMGINRALKLPAWNTVASKNPCPATLIPVINSVQNSGDFPLVDPIGILTAGALYPILP